MSSGHRPGGCCVLRPNRACIPLLRSMRRPMRPRSSFTPLLRRSGTDLGRSRLAWRLLLGSRLAPAAFEPSAASLVGLNSVPVVTDNRDRWGLTQGLRS